MRFLSFIRKSFIKRAWKSVAWYVRMISPFANSAWICVSSRQIFACVARIRRVEFLSRHSCGEGKQLDTRRLLTRSAYHLSYDVREWILIMRAATERRDAYLRAKLNMQIIGRTCRIQRVSAVVKIARYLGETYLNNIAESRQQCRPQVDAPPFSGSRKEEEREAVVSRECGNLS